MTFLLIENDFLNYSLLLDLFKKTDSVKVDIVFTDIVVGIPFHVKYTLGKKRDLGNKCDELRELVERINISLFAIFKNSIPKYH